MKKPKVKSAVTMPITLPIGIQPEEKDKSYRNRLKKLYGKEDELSKELMRSIKER